MRWIDERPVTAIAACKGTGFGACLNCKETCSGLGKACEGAPCRAEERAGCEAWAQGGKEAELTAKQDTEVALTVRSRTAPCTIETETMAHICSCSQVVSREGLRLPNCKCNSVLTGVLAEGERRQAAQL